MDTVHLKEATIYFCDQVFDNGLKLRSDEAVPGCFSSASPWPTLELEWGRKLYPSTGPRSSSLMFGLPPGNDLNQNRGGITALKEEPLGTRSWMQPAQQIKWVAIAIHCMSFHIHWDKIQNICKTSHFYTRSSSTVNYWKICSGFFVVIVSLGITNQVVILVRSLFSQLYPFNNIQYVTIYVVH